jgi:hypothetical protein
LPSSFSKTHSSTLGYSPCLPVSVSGTDSQRTRYEAFLGSWIRVTLRPLDSHSRLGVVIHRICLADPPTRLDHHDQRVADLSLLRHPFASLSSPNWCRNIRLLSIAYACRPRLRVRLTLSGLTFLRKPWAFGERVSHPFSRYSFRHYHFCFVDPTSSVELHPTAERSPTRRTSRCESIASGVDLSPAHYRRRIP